MNELISKIWSLLIISTVTILLGFTTTISHLDYSNGLPSVLLASILIPYWAQIEHNSQDESVSLCHPPCSKSSNGSQFHQANKNQKSLQSPVRSHMAWPPVVSLTSFSITVERMNHSTLATLISLLFLLHTSNVPITGPWQWFLGMYFLYIFTATHFWFIFAQMQPF